MEQLSKSNTAYESFDHNPVKVLQIGEGNFLRGFMDWMIQQMNKAGVFNGTVAAVQPTPHGRVMPGLLSQDGLYTIILRGRQNGRNVDEAEVISVITEGINPYENWQPVLDLAASEELEIITSNTTEAGITYHQETYNGDTAPLSYPGKLTAVLHHRFQTFAGDPSKGLIIVPCELIENNGDELKRIVRKISADWNLSSDFLEWIEAHNTFCNTLVDRIVTGYPKEQAESFSEQLGYEDRMMTVGEPYHMFAIDGGEHVKEKLPFHQAGLNVKWGNIDQHREIKVRLLNGPHTLMTPTGYLAGAETVIDVMEDEQLRHFIELGFSEINAVVNMNEEEKESFIQDVKERFLNPYNKHYLTDIAMNSVFKFKSRLLPVLKNYTAKYEGLPAAIVFSLASLFIYYQPVRRFEKGLIGQSGGKEYEARENEAVIAAFMKGWTKYNLDEWSEEKLVQSLLQHEDLWGEDLTVIPSLHEEVTDCLKLILSQGIREALKLKGITALGSVETGGK